MRVLMSSNKRPRTESVSSGDEEMPEPGIPSFRSSESESESDSGSVARRGDSVKVSKS